MALGNQMIFQYLKDRLGKRVPPFQKRNPHWPVIRAAFIIRNPKCAVCGGTEKLEVHHIIPFHADPLKELDDSNLITLCESKKGGLTCHLAIGHLGNYSKINPDVRTHAAYWAKYLSKADV